MRTGRACCQHCADDPVHDVPVDGHELPCDVCDDARFEADLRERIAQEIEEAHRAAPDCCAFDVAARIARGR